MRNSLSRWLVCYGQFLFVVAIVAVMYEPKSGQIGFNPAAKTALISGGVCGGLSIAWGMLLREGFLGAKIGALFSCTLFLGAFIWRASAAWLACAGGQPEKWFAATLITGMATATLGLLVLLLRYRTDDPHSEARVEPAELQSQPPN